MRPDFLLSRGLEENRFEYRFAEQEFFDGDVRSSMRMIGRMGRPIAWHYRTFRSRVVYLHKPTYLIRFANCAE